MGLPMGRMTAAQMRAMANVSFQDYMNDAANRVRREAPQMQWATNTCAYCGGAMHVSETRCEGCGAPK